MTGHEELLTVPEVAVLLRCSAPSIHRRIRNGQLLAIKSGDAPNSPVRVLAASVDEYITAHLLEPA